MGTVEVGTIEIGEVEVGAVEMGGGEVQGINGDNMGEKENQNKESKRFGRRKETERAAMGGKGLADNERSMCLLFSISYNNICLL